MEIFLISGYAVACYLVVLIYLLSNRKDIQNTDPVIVGCAFVLAPILAPAGIIILLIYVIGALIKGEG